ncbi:MAG: hypothetical protein OXJ52_05690, partial [Oligoflexia bacterium]|nr:hypothetical protein [Oligoflexia bacterium]
DVKTVKSYLSEQVKEETGKDKKTEKDKEKAKESEEEKSKEDESKEIETEDKKQDNNKLDENSKMVKDTKQGGSSKPAVPLTVGQKASSQTTTDISKSLSQKTTSKSETRKKPADKKAGDTILKTSSENSSDEPSSSNKNAKPSLADEKALSASLAGDTDNKSKCPIPMPQIISAVVYQSVEAPQIEPLDQQEFQKDPNKPHFTSYDLVDRKPAGVLVELGDFKNPSETFHLSLNIKDKFEMEVSECFHSPLNGQIMKEMNMKDCFFTGYDVLYDKHKFIPFPERIGAPGRTKAVKVKLYHKTYKGCKTTKNFELNIIRVHPLNLGFTAIDDKICKKRKNGYKFSVSDPQGLVEDFIKSKEVSEYIEAMFPIRELRTKLTAENNKMDRVRGKCNNKPPSYSPHVSRGVLKDIQKLEEKRKEYGFHKIVAIVPANYFFYHYKKNYGGLVVSPVWKQSFSKREWRGGSWNIALVSENLKNIGVLSHELGHTLGQGKEFYRKKDNKGFYLPDSKQSQCKKFNGSPEKLCHEYKIKLGLQAGKSKYKDIVTGRRTVFWTFIKDKFSIMNAESPIDNVWMDRDTLQKTFKVLSEREGGVAGKVVPFLDARSIKPTRPQVIFSGFYDTKRKKIILSDTELTKTKLKTVSISKDSGAPFMSFQLKYKNKVIKQAHQPVLGLEMKLIHKDGTHKKIPNSLSPFLVGFDINKSLCQQNL